MKRPLVVVALWYTGGVLLAEFCQPPLLILFALALACAGMMCMVARLRPWLLLPFVLVTGWTNLVCRTAIISPYDLRRVQGDSPAIVSLRGTLAETPSNRSFMRDEKEVNRSLAQVEVASLKRDRAGWQPTWGRVLVTTPGLISSDYFKGQRVELTGVLALPPGRAAEGLFDYRSYLKQQGIYYQLKVESTNDWRNLSPEVRRPFSDRFLEWAQATLARGLPEQDEPLKLLWAMTLGWRTGLTNEVYEPFMRSGTMHIFAISGLHIALIAGVLVSVLRTLFRLPRQWCGLIAIPLIWFYTGATGWQASAIRAAIMMTVVIGGWALERPANLLNSLAAAAFIILLWDPRQLFGASFQLSFFVVLSIALFVSPVRRVVRSWLEPDPLLAPERVPPWRRQVLRLADWVIPGVATSVAAWLGAWPLTVHYFHLFSWVTLAVNVLVVPISGLALTANLGSLACGVWWPWGAELFNHSAWFWMVCMVRLSQWACMVPTGYQYVSGLSLFEMAAYYGLLVGVMSGWLLVKGRRRVVVATVVVLFGVVYSWHLHTVRQQACLSVLPLGGGMALYYEHPSAGHDWAADPGPSNSVKVAFTPFLRAHGVDRLPRLLLTHGDAKHVGGAILADADLRVEQVVISPLRFRSPVYRRAMGHFRGPPDKLRTVSRGDRFEEWEVLHPEATGRYPRADDGALVLRGLVNGTRILLVSDLGSLGQGSLLASREDLQADIVVCGLPVGEQPLGEDLLDAIRPKLIVVCDSEFPASERAGLAVEERLGRRGIPVIYTRYSGAVKITLRSRGWELKGMDNSRLRWERGQLSGVQTASRRVDDLRE